MNSCEETSFSGLRQTLVAGMATDIANSLLNKPTWDSLYSAGRLSLEYIYREKKDILNLFEPFGAGNKILNFQ